jgi:hypothetical protein
MELATMGNDTTYHVYRIVSFRDGKTYVGLTVDPKRRKKEHFTDLKSGIHHNSYLQNSYNLHGKENFFFEVIESGVLAQDIKEREKYWIAHFDSYHNGYNLTLGGDELSDARKAPCTWNGVQYASVAEAARACGINLASMQDRLKYGHTCDDDLRPQLRPVTYNGTEYPSIKAAAIANNVTYACMKSRIQGGILSDDELYQSHRVTWNGIEYRNAVEAAQALGVTVGVMRGRISAGYASDVDLVGKGTPQRKNVVWNGVEYPSIKDAAEALGINYSTMRSRVQNGYTSDEDVIISRFEPQSIEIDGQIFANYGAAAELYGVTIAAICYWVKTGRARKLGET